MSGPEAERSLAGFCEVLRSAFAAVLSQISGAPWEVAKPEPAAEQAGKQVVDGRPSVQVNFICEKALEGAFSFRMTSGTALRLAKLLTCEPAPDPSSGLTADDREALDELLRQVAGQAASRLEPVFGKCELKFSAEAISGEQAYCIGVCATAAGEGLDMELLFDERLQHSVAAIDLPRPSAASVKGSALDGPSSSAVSAGGFTHRAIREGNLDLLLDVTLAVTLRFGQRELLLKDILELSPGSVVELDRAINEPVDLLLDKKVIARGEVVIIDGDYGLRVTEVASPAEKLACLP